MFIVVSGYCGPYNYTSEDGPLLELVTCTTPEAVEALHKEFRENAYGKHDSQQVFRVFEGKEVFLKPVETVTAYKLTRE